MAITLPKSLEMKRSRRLENGMRKKARKLLGDNYREGIHASDLLDPRQSYWRKVDPQPPTDTEVLYFLIGRVLHELILVHDDKGSDLGSFEHPQLGITYSPDQLTSKEGYPVELKTTRGWYEAKSIKDIDSYVEQLLIYMASLDVTEGVIVVLYLNLKKDPKNNRSFATEPTWRCYKVSILKADLKKVKTEIKKTAKAIKKAIETGDYEKLPLCRQWKCGDRCPYWEQCQPKGRYPNITRKTWRK